jgi:predicted nucleotidyltransferase
LAEALMKIIGGDDMNREIVLQILRTYKEEVGDRYDITALGVFGSVARGQATEESDVDVVIKTNTPNLLILSRIRQELEERIVQHVDVVHYREQMNPFLKKRIDRDALYV